MSGIVGIFHRDGNSLPPSLLESLTDFLIFRGPDKVVVWSEGPIGLGCTLLRTAPEFKDGSVLLSSSDQRLWITADVRLDCISELETRLKSGGCRLKDCEDDAALILKTYETWGEYCLEYLRGDFAFAIWDSQRKTLFCARDHFGIKPFYYVEGRDFFLFSNTLKCLRLHPHVSDELNDRAIADFLLFGLNCDVSTTTFRDIRRLPPAHFLLVSIDKLEMRRYWSVPIDGRVRYRGAEDYIRNFQNIFQLAVSDRSRTDRAGILLSGGLDSAAIATTAQKLSAESGRRPKLYAYTNTYETLLPDEDGSHARVTAACLNIPIRCLPFDNLKLFERWTDPAVSWPEPVDDPLGAGLFDLFRVIALDCRVALSGEGSDNLMYFQMIPHLKQLVRTREFRHAVADFFHYVSIRSFPWRGLRRLAGRIVGIDPLIPSFPEWIAPDFARRCDLKQRWKDWNRLPVPKTAHPTLPKALASLALPQWLQLFELTDPGVTQYPVEVRYPFLDLRVVNYLLAIPPFPWAFKKRILREAMSGHLPDSIRLRRKTPLMGDPVLKKLRLPESVWIDEVTWYDEIDRYINRSALLPLTKQKNSAQTSLAMRPLCLNFWLQSRSRVRYKLSVEV